MSTHYYRGGRYGDKRVISVSVRGLTLEFVAYSSLFSSREVDLGTLLLLENVRVPPSGAVLDVGCGYGAIGIAVAKMNGSLLVYMSDINPLAVKVAKYNAKLNGVSDRVVVLLGDRYEPVENMAFQAIYSNPPISAGREIVEDIVLGAREHLAEGGFAQFVVARGREHVVKRAKQAYSYVETFNKKGYTILYLEP